MSFHVPVTVRGVPGGNGGNALKSVAAGVNCSLGQSHDRPQMVEKGARVLL